MASILELTRRQTPENGIIDPAKSFRDLIAVPTLFWNLREGGLSRTVLAEQTNVRRYPVRIAQQITTLENGDISFTSTAMSVPQAAVQGIGEYNPRRGDYPEHPVYEATTFTLTPHGIKMEIMSPGKEISRLIAGDEDPERLSRVHDSVFSLAQECDADALASKLLTVPEDTAEEATKFLETLLIQELGATMLSVNYH